MAATLASTSSLNVTLAHAITYLTRVLIARYCATTIIKLQLALESNLCAQFASTWVPEDPLRGSGRRCLTLSPKTLPPRAIYNACQSAGINWSEWIALLGGVEFDLFIDPGCVSIRFGDWESGKVSKFFTVWSEELSGEVKKRKASEKKVQLQLRAQEMSRAANKTVAQQLMEDEEDEELFAMIAHEVREPTWFTPIADKFPAPTPDRSISSSPVSTTSVTSNHSRSSSRSSNSSSGFSVFSQGSAVSYGSATTVSLSSPEDDKPAFKLSRRERARQAKVFVDASKTAVTNYDGGKTTVLTGGVMLGGVVVAAPSKAPSPSSKKASSSASSNWRSARV
ncbi:BTG family protein [Abortiporus biennis]